MDAHLLTKIIHMTAVAAALMVFVLRASTLFIGVQGEQPNPAGRKVLVALQHLSFTVVFITGAILLVMKNFQVQRRVMRFLQSSLAFGISSVLSQLAVPTIWWWPLM
ncbi:hypothetical protein M3Q_355 [Acinetobacter baumannii TYTH-1]|nr:hypothetical protein M3Q_355 [Acinetobacter baumannii TYTH-1]